MIDYASGKSFPALFATAIRILDCFVFHQALTAVANAADGVVFGLRRRFRYMADVIVPAGTYRGQTMALKSAAAWNVVIALRICPMRRAIDQGPERRHQQGRALSSWRRHGLGGDGCRGPVAIYAGAMRKNRPKRWKESTRVYSALDGYNAVTSVF